MNETIRNIMGRRSIRKYKDRPVDRETLDALLKAGAAAPSASNRQPWEFIVITSREMREGLSRSHPYARMLLQAPVCIIVCGNKERFYPDKEVQDYWAQDAAAVTENILVAAQSRWGWGRAGAASSRARSGCRPYRSCCPCPTASSR